MKACSIVYNDFIGKNTDIFHLSVFLPIFWIYR